VKETNHCEMCNRVGGTLLWRDSKCRVVMVDDSDYPGFCRVIWDKHVKEMTDLVPQDRTHLMVVVFAVEAAIRASLKPDKVNLASLGNLTPHLHWHVIPRHIRDKHFPQPIWGAAQRESSSSPPSDWKNSLIERLRANLADETC
jgi:diadenosine tetraphosphate (Ap4A) HIT family hydrolase